MKSIELIILNLEEVRRRNIKLWTSIPKGTLHWKPDDKAMSCLEMVRHVLDSEHYYHLSIKNQGSLPVYESPFEKQPLISVEAELNFAEPYRRDFWKRSYPSAKKTYPILKLIAQIWDISGI